MAEREVDRSVSQTVKAQLALRDQILSGALRPGERISELQAVETTGASRTPVRMVLGLPALVIGLPNNLTPFVDAGVMLGADGPEKIRQSLETLLYDRQVRQRIAEAAGAFVQEYDLAPQPGAARRAADRILALAKRT